MLAACCCGVLLAGTLPGSSLAEAGPFTLLVYMTGSDLESRGQAASGDLREMAAALPEDSGIRVLVQTGGALSWGEGLPADRINRLEILPGRTENAESLPNRSMGDGDTLRDFLQWGTAYAPADRYGLILWNHGAGPLMGICFDEQHLDGEGKKDALSLGELGEALGQSPFRERKLAFLGMDACLMCSLETAAAVSPYAEYLIASQDMEPAGGWDYSFLKGMTGKEDGAEWGRRIIGAYGESLKDSASPATLACLDLGRTPALLEAMEAFFTGITESVTPESYPDYTACRTEVKAFGTVSTSEYDLIDLMDLAELYETYGLGDSEGLKAALRNTVVLNYTKKSDYTNGLSIYYPFDNKDRYIASWAALYQREGRSPAYGAFIRRLSDFYLQESLFDPDSSYQLRLTEYEGKTRIELPLSPEEKKQVARSRLLVLEEVAAGNYRLIWYDDQRVRDREDRLSVQYGSEALFLTDGEGKILAGPISYLPADHGIALYGELIRDFHATAARLVYQQGEDGKLELSQIFMAQEDSGLFLPSSVRLEDYDEILVLSLGPQNVPEGETVTSLKMAPYFPAFTVSIDPGDPSRQLAFLPAQGRYPRFAYLRMTDIHGETFFSEVKELPGYNRIRVAGSRDLKGNKEISAELEEGTLVTGYDAGLMFTLRLRNETAGTMILTASGARLEGAVIGERELEALRFSLAPGESDRISVFLPLKTLQKLELPEEIRRAAVQFTVQDDRGQESLFETEFEMTMNGSFLREND